MNEPTTRDILNAYVTLSAMPGGELILEDILNTYLFRRNPIVESELLESMPDAGQRALYTEGQRSVALAIYDAFHHAKEALNQLTEVEENVKTLESV